MNEIPSRNESGWPSPRLPSGCLGNLELLQCVFPSLKVMATSCHSLPGLGMENIGGIFVVLICGLIVAIFMAMLEFLWTLRHSEASEVSFPKLPVAHRPQQCATPGFYKHFRQHLWNATTRYTEWCSGEYFSPQSKWSEYTLSRVHTVTCSHCRVFTLSRVDCVTTERAPDSPWTQPSSYYWEKMSYEQ